jgi:L-fuculose-phosphate aldolase
VAPSGNEAALREAICEIGRRMYARNLVAATDGNISVRLEHDRYLCTPSGVSKGFMQPGDLVVADGQGARVRGQGRVTSEFLTHLAAYEERPDMAAVCHAHPPTAVAFTLAGRSLARCVLPEVVMSIGGVPTTPYATPGTPEGNDVVRPLIRQCDALLLDRHGALTVGVDLFDAYFKLEKVEHAAATLLAAHQLGDIRTLDAGEVERLAGARTAYGAKGLAYPCTSEGSGGA